MSENSPPGKALRVGIIILSRFALFFSANLFAAAGAGRGRGARSFTGAAALALEAAVGSLSERLTTEVLYGGLLSPVDLFSF